MAPVSLKRGRSWLEIGIVGCSFLTWSAPAVTASSWPLAGTVWQSTPKVPVMPSRRSRGLDKDASSLVGPPAAAVPLTLEEDHILLPRNDGLVRMFPRRFLTEDRLHGLHVAVGEWSSCDTETCTQSRPVMCETSDFKFVPNEMCSDDLLEAVKECDNPRACRPGNNTDSTEKVTAGSGLPSSRTPSRADASERSAAGSANSSPGGTSKESKGAGMGGGVRGSSATVVNGNPSEAIPSVTVVEAGDARQSGVGASGETESNGNGVGKEERWEKSAAKGEASMPSPEQENLGDDQNASTSKRKPSFAAARGAAQKVDRVGGSSTTGSGPNDRFWTVLAIGAGAVGSFLAVAVFAIHQYRKEQHRHRGIMALNEFPQDNYINPFARQLSEEDRTAFKL